MPLTTVTGSMITPSTTLSGDVTVTGTMVMGSSFMRNRIINGDMRIDQRNAGASVTPTSDGSYNLDRWKVGITQASKFSVQQSSTAPTGFSYSALITSLSAYSVGSGDTFLFQQNIEGFNTADLNWGTANAQTVTLSFWVRSSITGTFGGSVINSAANRAYLFSYTISSANTWEQKSVTITGDTTGTWVGATNGIGIGIRFGLGSGSTFSGTTGVWQNGNIVQPTGTVSVVGTNGATFYITGVQLEIGSTATPFERRLYGQELMLCQRYYQTFGGDYAYYRFGSGQNNQTTTNVSIIPFFVPMRASPTMSYSSISHFSLWFNNSTIAATNVTSDYTSTNNAAIQITVASGLTQGGYSQSMAYNTTSARLNYSAEL